MIPRPDLTAWRAEAPWPSDAQVEQDLVRSGAVVERFGASTSRPRTRRSILMGRERRAPENLCPIDAEPSDAVGSWCTLPPEAAMGRIAMFLAAVLCAAAVWFLVRRDEERDPTSAPGVAVAREAGPEAPPPPLAGPPLEGAHGSRGGDAPADAKLSAVGGTTTYQGNVFTAAGLPAVDAQVEAVVHGVVLARVRTDEAGAFALHVPDAPSVLEQRGSLRARGSDGGVALALLVLTLRGAPGDGAGALPADAPRIVGPLRLGPPHSLTVRVQGACRADEPATLWLLPATVMFGVPWTTLQTDASGHATFEGLPAGTWSLVAAAPGCGRARSMVQLPRDAAGPLEIQLEDPRTLTLRVRDAADQAPIAGAVVRLRERLRLPDYSTVTDLHSTPDFVTTDAEGLARVEGLSGQETLLLSAQAEGYPSAGGPDRGRGGRGPGEAQVEPGQSEAVIELHKPLTVRWPLTNEGLGIPADGTEARIEPWTNTGRLVVPPRGVIEGRELVVPGWASDGASGYAVVAGHGVARLQANPKETTGYPTAFYPLRKIDLVARHADGTPAQGWFLVVRDGGNNAVKPGVKTDAEGRATMDALYGGPGSLVSVSVAQADGWGGFVLAVGSVNLLERDGRFEATIPAERRLRIRLTLQGAALPAGLAAWPTLNHEPVPAPSPERAAAEPGLFEARWRPRRPDAPAIVSAQAVGYLAETKEVPAAAQTTDVEVGIDLRPAGSVQLQVKEPEDKRSRIAIDRWDAEKGTWGTAGDFAGFASGRGQRPNPNGVVEFQGLETGRYRPVDTASGLTGEPFEVVAGQGPTRVAFDVSMSGWARGRVVLPVGVPFADVTVGEPEAKRGATYDVMRSMPLPGSPVNPNDGTFWIRVPGTRPVTLRIFHPTLLPHPSLGQVTLTKPQEGLELHAVRGATARLRFATPAPVYVNPGQPRPIAVRLYTGQVEGAGTVLTGLLDGAHTTVEFGGYDPGTYTVWVDAPGSAPVVLPGVVLGASDVDLGEVTLSSGASLELQVTVKEGQSAPRISVWAQGLDEPTYTRSVDAFRSTVTLRGLGAGRFLVTAMAYDGATPGINEEITFDGRSKVVRRLGER